jgi:hypothetical protein
MMTAFDCHAQHVFADAATPTRYRNFHGHSSFPRLVLTSRGCT